MKTERVYRVQLGSSKHLGMRTAYVGIASTPTQAATRAIARGKRENIIDDYRAIVIEEIGELAFR